MHEEDVLGYYPRLKFDRVPEGEIPDGVRYICVVDCPYELTANEFGANQVRFPEYRTLQWDKDKFILERANRIRRIGSKQSWELDYWGKLIASKSMPDFLSHDLLEAI
jgi:hypothetical protein